MARIRTVKPELFRHEELHEAEVETGLPLRLAFIGLFTCCDREGRFKWRPMRLKLDVLPYDEIEFERVLDALLTRGFLVKYKNKGKEYGAIPTFPDHQVINNREKASELPGFYDEESETLHHVDSKGKLTREARVDDADSEELQGNMEGKGREGNMEHDSKSRDSRDDLAADVIEYLNKAAGKNYQVKKTNTEHIRARISEGYTWEQFKHAIDVKIADWKGTDREMYLRPTTLFNSKKFDGYVNQPKPARKKELPGDTQPTYQPGTESHHSLEPFT